MKLLLLGRNGQLGRELQRSLSPLGELVALGRREENGLNGDLSNFDTLQHTIRTLSPTVIVNAAAYTAVDAAEQESEQAWRVNAEAPALLAREAARCGARLVHFSTDYVFEGSQQTPYREDDTPHPLSVYGASKLEGEYGVTHAGCSHLLFRTSWVYAAHGRNFARTMLRLAHERERLQVVADQIGAPTSAALIADVTALCLYRLTHDNQLAARANGIYHLTAAGHTSWHGWAKYLVEQAQSCGLPLRVSANQVDALTSAEYPQKAPRPANSRLDTSRLRHTFGLSLPPWQQDLPR